uniref:Proteoglycan 4 n=2 Tax=Lutzomyia longipalpis TaxID=7200 RepID=A0A1B0CDR1_LUTLO
MSNLDTSSQHNKIVPLAAMSNAPFEQTFRITVSLPRDQLYVARVGAKTRLAQLMELTCVNKQLDRDKYEFRHPMDNSQVFSNDLTIGEVGLNEIRLVPKTERLHNGNNFNIDDLNKMRLPGNRESLSSSEVSRNSRQFLKTTSPYSSTNSLNSVESSGSHPRHQPPVAPARKKRAAPRPPSQNSIPEHQMDINRNTTKTTEFKKPLPVKKNFHVSSPNLSVEETNQLVTSAEVHRNGSPIAERYSSVTDLRSHDTPQGIVEANNMRLRPMSMHIVNGNHHHVNGKESPSTDPNHSRTSSESSEMRESLPEPVPRKRQLFAAKKKKAAPAPPPRSVPPVPTPRSIPKSESSADEEMRDVSTNLPNGNVSKVMLNVDATQAINVNLVKQNVIQEERKECMGVKVVEMKPNGPLSIAIKTTQMKQEEPSKVSITEIRRESTNSSDDDDHRVNIYSIKMGKVIEPSQEAQAAQGKLEEVQKEPVELPKASIEQQKTPIEQPKASPEQRKASIELPKTPIENSNYNKASPEHLEPPKVPKEQPIVQKESPKCKVSPIESQKIVQLHQKSISRSRKQRPKVSEENDLARSPSPLWTYTLPAPPKFADGNSSVPDDVATLNGNVYYDYMSLADDTRTVQSDSNTTLVSDVDIRPVIREVIADPYTTLDAEVINSDLEDGYQRNLLLQSLEKRRERYIENEFAFLTKMDDDREPEKDAEVQQEVVVKDFAIEKMPPRKQQSIEEGKNEVIDELNSVISSNRIESVIRRVEQPEEIDAAKPCNLSNFRISTYTVEEDTHTAVKPVVKPVVNGSGSPEEEFNEEDFLRRASIDVEERPRDYVKRPSLTQSTFFRKTTPVARSDSFHSTRADFGNSFAGTPRSSSYISLLAAQKFESRTSPRHSVEFPNPPRRYSSELSITDSPSLQSIEVMKSILSSSRKNSMTHLPEVATVGEEKAPQELRVEILEKSEPEKAVLVQRVEVKKPPPPVVEKKVELNGRKLEQNERKQEENERKLELSEKKLEQNERKLEQNEKKPELNGKKQEQIEEEEAPKKWVYKGPPKINLSAWNERPKVQVCIKSDSDYCFGGSTTLPRGFRTDQAISVPVPEKKEPEGLNNHLPVVRGVEYKKNVPPLEEQCEPAAVILRKPEVRQKPVNRVNSITSASPNVRPLSLGNFSKIAPVVRGFRAEEEAAQQHLTRAVSVTKINSSAAVQPAPAPAVVMSEKKIEKVPEKVPEKIPERKTNATFLANGQQKSSPPEAPFWQHTLRKTGLKEK